MRYLQELCANFQLKQEIQRGTSLFLPYLSKLATCDVFFSNPLHDLKNICICFKYFCYSLRWVREATVENPWGWSKPEQNDFCLDHIALGASARARSIPEYDVDAVLSAGELVIDEEERALLQNMGLEASAKDAAGKPRRNCAEKMQVKKSGMTEDPMTKPLEPNGKRFFS